MGSPTSFSLPVGGSTALELKPQPEKTLEQEKLRLRKAAKEFESFFVYYMLKTMRQSVVAGNVGKASLGDGLGKEAFTDMFDIELSRKISVGGHSSLAELLYKSAEKNLLVRHSDTPALPHNTHFTKDPMMKLNLSSGKSTEITSTLPSRTAKKPSSQAVATENSRLIKQRYQTQIESASDATKLDSALIAAVISVESGGKPDAVSPRGAQGLMQLMPKTADELGVASPFKPADNILAGSRYLRSQFDRFGDIKLALAAYNAGPETVARFGTVPPYPETQQYVERVTALYARTKHLYSDESQSVKIEQ